MQKRLFRRGPASVWVQGLRGAGVVQGRLTTRWIALKWPRKARAIFIYTLTEFLFCFV